VNRKAKTTQVRRSPEHDDVFSITALGIGHGDAILIECISEGERWTCLIDGGESPSQLEQCLKQHIRPVSHIDLLVLSHIDNDHLGGLIGITKVATVGEYWGPALPAFRRHLWAFGERCQTSISRAEQLEEELAAGGVERIYPLEGFSSAPITGAELSISVLFPPPKLIRRLLTYEDINDLLTPTTTPLGAFLIEDDSDEEEPASLARLDRELKLGFLSPATIPSEFRRDARAQTNRSPVATHPEFFGDSLLNNTSITLYVTFRSLSGSLSSILLPGDLENWSYLFAKHPRGLHADVLKAPHHGGRVYVESSEAENDLFNAIQPKILLMSANGRHSLPRSSTRNAAVIRGATVFCTASRTREIVCGQMPTLPSCHEHFSCTGETQSRTISFSASGISSNSVACHSGFPREPGPVIQLQQHIIAPSGVFNSLLERELRRHIEWVRKELLKTHAEHRATHGSSSPISTISSQDIVAAAKRGPRPRPSLIENIDSVFQHGSRRLEFWATPVHRNGPWHCYSMPSKQDISVFTEWIASRETFIFLGCQSVNSRNCESMLASLADSCMGLHEIVHNCLAFPIVTFQDLFWPIFSECLIKDWWVFHLVPDNTLVFSKKHKPADVATELLSLVNAFRSDSLPADAGTPSVASGGLPATKHVVCTRPLEGISIDESLYSDMFRIDWKQACVDTEFRIENPDFSALKEEESEFRTQPAQTLGDACVSQVHFEFIDALVDHFLLLARILATGSHYELHRCRAWRELWSEFSEIWVGKLPDLVASPKKTSQIEFGEYPFLNKAFCKRLSELDLLARQIHDTSEWLDFDCLEHEISAPLMAAAAFSLSCRLTPLVYWETMKNERKVSTFGGKNE
jgi:beta-lactamase superfamily II metal-dependent hydrolase